MGRLALLGAVAAGAAAVVLLPTVLALRAGQRVPFTYDELRQQFLAEPFMLKRLFLPPDLPMTADQMQYLGFVGSSTVVFALVGLFSRRRAGAWLARVLVVAVPLIMIGTPLTALTWRFVPGMNVFRPYSRLIVFAAFGLVLAAALGVQMVLDGIARQRPTLQPAIRVGLAMAIVVTAGQLMFLGRRSNPPFVPHEARYALPSTPLIEEVRGNANPNGWPARVIPVFLRRANDSALSGVTLYANTAQAVGLDTMSGYDSSVDRRTLVLLRVLNGADPNDTPLGRYPAAFLAAYYAAWCAAELNDELPQQYQLPRGAREPRGLFVGPRIERDVSKKSVQRGRLHKGSGPSMDATCFANAALSTTCRSSRSADRTASMKSSRSGGDPASRTRWSS